MVVVVVVDGLGSSLSLCSTPSAILAAVLDNIGYVGTGTASCCIWAIGTCVANGGVVEYEVVESRFVGAPGCCWAGGDSGGGEVMFAVVVSF